MKAMEKAARKPGLANNYESNIKHILQDHIDIFLTSFSSSLAASLYPLTGELMPDVEPVNV